MKNIFLKFGGIAEYGPSLTVLLWLSLSAFLWTGCLAGLSSPDTEWSSGRLRLVFDDYYQKERPEGLFAQGVARGGKELRDLTNFYSPDATAIPNGTFVFSQLLTNKFSVETNRNRLDAERLDGVAVFLLICPIRVEHGGRESLGEREGEILEAFVAEGGSLVLVGNSVSDPEKGQVDLNGMNIIAGRFGLKFLSRQTETMSIPIEADHPLFDGVSAMIYGNGTIVEVLPSADPATEILLESHNESVPGPVAVLAPYKRGKVLLFGDAGSFGNAHLFRGDIGQAIGLQQMIYGLLPDGPVPRYNWKEGASISVRLKQEQILSGYPELMRVFDLPPSEGTVTFTAGMRRIDLDSGNREDQASPNLGFVSAVRSAEAEFVLKIGKGDGRSFESSWQSKQGDLSFSLLLNGRLANPGIPRETEMGEWQRILLNDLICAPLKAYAQPGDEWEAHGFEALPNALLTMKPAVVLTPMRFVFLGEAIYNGQECYRIRRTVRLEGGSWTPQDFVGPQYSPQFNAGAIEILAGGQLAIADYWILKDSLLPLHSEIRVSAALWWSDTRFPAKYIGSHDSKNYENWENINFNATYGRVLTADFEVL